MSKDPLKTYREWKVFTCRAVYADWLCFRFVLRFLLQMYFFPMFCKEVWAREDQLAIKAHIVSPHSRLVIHDFLYPVRVLETAGLQTQFQIWNENWLFPIKHSSALRIGVRKIVRNAHFG